MANLDQYFTPVPVARRLVEAVKLPGKAMSCADPTCGSGNLLTACEDVLEGVSCLGVDRDLRVIRRLRRTYPHWRLSAADLLCDRSMRSTAMHKARQDIDLLALNPPFTQCQRKFVEISFCGAQMRASTAMGYLLRSLDILRPRFGAVAILPESLLYSDIDREARSALATNFQIRELFELRSSAFSGARARTVAVQVFPYSRTARDLPAVKPLAGEELIIVRGSMPFHDVRVGESGIPFIHTTDLLSLATGDRQPAFFSRLENRSVFGWQLLLPRVGLPRQSAVVPVFIRKRSELSDCVIALGAGLAALEQLTKAIHLNWDSYCGLYRGTGARYITLSRLMDWLGEIGFTTRKA